MSPRLAARPEGPPAVPAELQPGVSPVLQGSAADAAPEGAGFSEFLVNHAADVPVVSFLFNLLLAGLLAALLGRAYVRFGTSLSNRAQFARNFLLLAMTVMLIITIVKSSLALSLGLVGALSIVRYRAAIKEPEELGYLFLAISIGLGTGANQWRITVLAFVVIMAVLWLRTRLGGTPEGPNLYLTVGSDVAGAVGLPRIVEVLRRHCTEVELKRFDEGSAGVEAAFLVSFADFERLEAGRRELRELDDSVSVSLLDGGGVV